MTEKLKTFDFEKAQRGQSGCGSPHVFTQFIYYQLVNWVELKKMHHKVSHEQFMMLVEGYINELLRSLQDQRIKTKVETIQYTVKYFTGLISKNRSGKYFANLIIQQLKKKYQEFIIEDCLMYRACNYISIMVKKRLGKSRAAGLIRQVTGGQLDEIKAQNQQFRMPTENPQFFLGWFFAPQIPTLKFSPKKIDDFEEQQKEPISIILTENKAKGEIQLADVSLKYQILQQQEESQKDFKKLTKDKSSVKIDIKHSKQL